MKLECTPIVDAIGAIDSKLTWEKLSDEQREKLTNAINGLVTIQREAENAINVMAATHVALHNPHDPDYLIAELCTAIYKLKSALYPA